MGRSGTILLMINLAALAILAVVRFPAHLADIDWPPHAKAHLIVQIGTTVALAILCAAILAGPFRSGKPWAWWCLAAVGLGVYGGYWAAHAVAEPGAPWRGGNTTFSVLTICHFSGLALSWRNFFGAKQ